MHFYYSVSIFFSFFKSYFYDFLRTMKRHVMDTRTSRIAWTCVALRYILRLAVRESWSESTNGPFDTNMSCLYIHFLRDRKNVRETLIMTNDCSGMQHETGCAERERSYELISEVPIIVTCFTRSTTFLSNAFVGNWPWNIACYI